MNLIVTKVPQILFSPKHLDQVCTRVLISQPDKMICLYHNKTCQQLNHFHHYLTITQNYLGRYQARQSVASLTSLQQELVTVAAVETLLSEISVALLMITVVQYRGTVAHNKFLCYRSKVAADSIGSSTSIHLRLELSASQRKVGKSPKD